MGWGSPAPLGLDWLTLIRVLPPESWGGVTLPGNPLCGQEEGDGYRQEAKAIMLCNKMIILFPGSAPLRVWFEWGMGWSQKESIKVKNTPADRHKWRLLLGASGVLISVDRQLALPFVSPSKATFLLYSSHQKFPFTTDLKSQ